MGGASKLTRRGLGVLLFVSVFTLSGKASSVSESAGGGSFFVIRVVDEQTGRGVPLMELKTTNGISFWTDSQGVIAFFEPGLMEREVYFLCEVRGMSIHRTASEIGGYGCMCGREKRPRFRSGV